MTAYVELGDVSNSQELNAALFALEAAYAQIVEWIRKQRGQTRFNDPNPQRRDEHPARRGCHERESVNHMPAEPLLWED